MLLVLVRHTRPNVRPGTCYGRLDVPLARSAPQDLNASLQRIPTVSRVITSPTQRCRLLAEAVAERDGLSVEEDARLLELDFGTWEGQPWRKIGEAALDTWSQNIWRYAPGGGEALSDLWARIDAFRQEIAGAARSSVVIISHHGPLRTLYAQCTGRSHEKLFDQSFEFGEVHELERVRNLPFRQAGTSDAIVAGVDVPHSSVARTSPLESYTPAKPVLAASPPNAARRV